MADVFVSYASEDRDRIAPLVRALEQQGWTVWWDRNIRPGAQFQRAISDAIDDARCVVVCWTSLSIESEWVLNEANDGKERGILVPVLLDDVRPPIGFRMTQMADLRHWDAGTDPSVLGEIVSAVGACLGSDPSPTIPHASPPSTKRSTLTRPGALAALVVVAAVAIWLAVKQLPATGGPCVAVLPFDVVSAATDQDWIGDSVATEFHSKLRELNPNLCVSGRSTSFTYGARDLDVREMGQELGVEYILKGVVQLSGITIRVTAELISVETGYLVWDFLREGNLDDGFGAQIAIATLAMPSLSLQLDQELPPSLRLSSASTAPTDASGSALQRLVDRPGGGGLPTIDTSQFDSFGTEGDE
ncbi:MAG: TIR domain-containing protein [Gammaproteobacteria bacterium]|nr:TIR domain-containing protein [Gammaproteobacteria bacterium]